MIMSIDSRLYDESMTHDIMTKDKHIFLIKD